MSWHALTPNMAGNMTIHITLFNMHFFNFLNSFPKCASKSSMSLFCRNVTFIKVFRFGTFQNYLLRLKVFSLTEKEFFTKTMSKRRNKENVSCFHLYCTFLCLVGWNYSPSFNLLVDASFHVLNVSVINVNEV